MTVARGGMPGPVINSGNPAIDQLVRDAAAKYSLDPNLIFSVMRQESGFNPRATSYKGARGLMQLMPATAARLGVRDIYDPAQNIDGGARYLRFLLNQFNGNVELALAGYNAGEGAVARYGNQVPPYRETMHYVQTISARYYRTRAAVAAPPPEPVRRGRAKPEMVAAGDFLFRGDKTLTSY
ncbi:MAG: lytic transglycosylase domain-containing protein [Blastocatellia bacterium]